MHDRSRKRPLDLNQLAKALVTEATGEHDYHPEPQKIIAEPTGAGKNPAAVALGRLGGVKGGNARAEKLTPEHRREIAKKAAMSRWQKKH
jgi:hypothetical protein